MKNGYPSESAEYILQNNIGRTRARNNRNNFVLQNKDFQRSFKMVIGRINRLQSQVVYEMEEESTEELNYVNEG